MRKLKRQGSGQVTGLEGSSKPIIPFNCEVCGKPSGTRDKKSPKLCAKHYVQRKRNYA